MNLEFLMITFEEMAGKILVEHGNASDRYNREVGAFAMKMYLAGLEAGHGIETTDQLALAMKEVAKKKAPLA